MAADLIPTIVIAIGAAVVGAPDALRFLLSVAGRSPAVDIFVCVFAIAMATTAVLGGVLLARYFRGHHRVLARNAGAAAARREEVFPRTVRMAGFTVAFLVAACLLAAPSVQKQEMNSAGRYVCPA